MPEPEPMQSAGANSLWRSGAKGFFRDQRARRVGDILTVQVSMSDNANWSNQTTRSRKNDDHLGIPGFFGLQNLAVKALPDAMDGTPVDPDDSSRWTARPGTPAGRRQPDEEIRMNLAAVITQLLPNGNLVIHGRQEVRVNFEMREVVVAGIIRPEDITPRNTIAHEKIAELRVALWRTRPDHRRPAAALRRAGPGYPAALLRRDARRLSLAPAPRALRAVARSSLRWSSAGARSASRPRSADRGRPSCQRHPRTGRPANRGGSRRARQQAWPAANSS